MAFVAPPPGAGAEERTWASDEEPWIRGRTSALGHRRGATAPLLLAYHRVFVDTSLYPSVHIEERV